MIKINYINFCDWLSCETPEKLLRVLSEKGWGIVTFPFSGLCVQLPLIFLIKKKWKNETHIHMSKDTSNSLIAYTFTTW